MQSPKLSAQSHEFTGYFDSFEDGLARGWAFDRERPDHPVTLHVVVDRQEVARIECDLFREDLIRNLGHPSGRVGFEYRVATEHCDGQFHELSFRLPNRKALGIIDPARPDQPIDKVTFSIAPHVIEGNVDGLWQGQLRGWAVRRLRGDPVPRGSCQVRISSGGRTVAMVRADKHRRDVAGVMECDPNCGFQVAIPAEFRRGVAQTFHFHVLPDDVELPNSPVTTSLVDDDLHVELLAARDRMDTLFRDFVGLRKAIDRMVPQLVYTLADYDRWAREYYRALTRRVAAARVPFDDAPLVSVLIPAYRPLLSDFTAAVESVLAQTYQNWELIIVDDASKSPELTAQIAAFVKRDSRVRSVVRRNNGNISEATNTAIKSARGHWIALFDHDDLLVDVALEVMLDAARATGAELMYSDEDKIDQAGYFLEPNLKPNWNHRYMLGCNYACHLLVVTRERLDEAGHLRTAYNGAQDHDLMLRLSEVIPASRIHHVPEILYHWRMTPNSTAVDIGNKDYAKTAGVRAVQDHLDRLQRPAEVSSINGLTIYRVRWQSEATPSVCVIVPYREQIEMTQRCLDRLIETDASGRFEVLLVDNWSTSRDAERFAERAAMLPGVRVLRIEEPFNYARINNLAVAETDAEVIVFMNNDVLVDDANWLRAALGEFLYDPTVAAVGGKFVYPNRTVQHAGVVVGPDGIAAHAHLGQSHDDYGYIGRAVLSHEITAVTAAGMLVRASVFREIGGFDEERLTVAFNDVDLCLKIRTAGYKIVYCADFTAEHHESYSRGSDDDVEKEKRFFYERETMLERWGNSPLFQHDPAYSRFFTVDRTTFFDLQSPDLPANVPCANARPSAAGEGRRRG